jgi:hypothetical protein
MYITGKAMPTMAEIISGGSYAGSITPNYSKHYENQPGYVAKRVG